MKIKNRKRLIGIICALMVCLIASTAFTVVVADEPYWGDLKVGDEMRWKWGPGYAHTGWRESIYELEILEIQGESLKVDHREVEFRGTEFEEYTIKCGKATLTSDDLICDLYELRELTTKIYWIYPVSLMRENENIKTSTYEFNGNNYKAAYIKEESSKYQHEFWWDYNTGILFKYYQEPGPSTVTNIRLEYTNADLTEPTVIGFCLGTILIAFVSVTILVTYGFVKYQKKKKHKSFFF